jgi:hypothetical protein
MDIVTATARPFFRFITGARDVRSSNVPKPVDRLTCITGVMLPYRSKIG